MNQKNKIITISLAFLTLLILMFWNIGGGISGWDMLTARPVPSSYTQYPTPSSISANWTPPPSPAPTDWTSALPKEFDYSVSKEVDVNGWKTLTSKAFSFEIKLPGDWIAYSYQQVGQIETDFSAPRGLYPDTGFYLKVEKKTLGEWLGEINQRIKQEGWKVTKENVQIGNIKMIRITFGAGSSAPTSDYLFEYRGRLYDFYNSSPNNKEFTFIADKIIHSFRFLD